MAKLKNYLIHNFPSVGKLLFKIHLLGTGGSFFWFSRRQNETLLTELGEKLPPT